MQGCLLEIVASFSVFGAGASRAREDSLTSGAVSWRILPRSFALLCEFGRSSRPEALPKELPTSPSEPPLCSEEEMLTCQEGSAGEHMVSEPVLCQKSALFSDFVKPQRSKLRFAGEKSAKRGSTVVPQPCNRLVSCRRTETTLQAGWSAWSCMGA